MRYYLYGVIAIIVLVGCLLLFMLWGRLREAEGAMRVRKSYRGAGVNDLLNYSAMVADGIIACKNGALMAAYRYSGDDQASRTDAEKERVSAVINSALCGLGDGWMIHVDAVRQSSPNYIPKGVSHFADPITQAIDEERRSYFENRGNMYEGYFVLTVTWLPPLLTQQKFVELMFDDDSAPRTVSARFSALLNNFNKELQTIESRLSAVFKLERLKSGFRLVPEVGEQRVDHFLEHLQFCITGLRHPITLPKSPVCLDSLLGGQELWGGVIPKIGNNYIGCVSIEGYPIESFPGILAMLTDFDVEYRWSNRFIFLDSYTAAAHMEKFQKKWKQKQRGVIAQVMNSTSANVDQDAVNMTVDAEEAISEVKSGLVGTGYYTSVLVVMHPDRRHLEAACQKLQKAIFNLGFSARIESVNCLEAWLGSLPGHGHENVRRPLVSTLNFADLVPSSSIWTGENQAPCPFYPPGSPPLMYCVTTGYSPFRLNLHVRDLGHTMIFGPTGSGKSVSLGILVAQFMRYKGATAFVFDKGMSMYALTCATGGDHFEIAGEHSELQFCPLQFLQTQQDQAWARDWIETVINLNSKEPVTPSQRTEIARCIKIMAETGVKTISDFTVHIQDTGIREIFQAYTINGPMGSLLDAESDGLSLRESGITCFEMEEIMNLGERWSLPILLYLFRRIEKSFHGQPGLIVLDEAWLLLAHPVFKEKIREWLKVMRKANVAVVMATQSLSDAQNSNIFDVILESSATKIFLPNVYARGTSAEQYAKMGLNEQQREIISSAIPKREYYLVSEKGCRLFSFAVGPLAISIIGASDKDSVAKIKELQKIFGNKWLVEWFKIKGILTPENDN
ncbi:MAG: conjugal transfer protein TrbE [Lachnospiraceae bacterium]|nr:conjugal transfer protein TrbE [Lachnospiraceae bacterium]